MSRDFFRFVGVVSLVLLVGLPAVQAEQYAVLFSSGNDAAANPDWFYSATMRMYNALVYQAHYRPENIWILGADGLDPAADQDDGTTSSDWSVPVSLGTTVLSSSPTNLRDTLQSLPCGERDTFVFWAFSHGAGTVNDPADHTEEELCGWGTNITDNALAGSTYLGSVQAGRQAYVLGNCFSGGMLEEFGMTGGDGRFGCASANHYETAHHISGLPSGIGNFNDAFTEGITNGLTFTHDLYQHAYANTPRATDGEGPEGTWDEDVQHPWKLGDDFDIVVAEWMGYDNGSWTDGDNWEDMLEPDYDRTVRLTGTRPATLDGINDTIRQMIMYSGTELHLAGGGSLEVTADLENVGGYVRVSNGTLIVGTELLNSDPASGIGIGASGVVYADALDNVGQIGIGGHLRVYHEATNSGIMTVHGGGWLLTDYDLTLTPEGTLSLEGIGSTASIGYDLLANGTISVDTDTTLLVDNMLRAGDGGADGKAQITIGGGLLTVTNQLKLGITNDAVLTANDAEIRVGSLFAVGAGNKATCTLNGGEVEAVYLHVGDASGSQGYLTMEAASTGTPTVRLVESAGGAAPQMVVGYDAYGHVVQNAGVVTRAEPDVENPDPLYPTLIIGRNVEAEGLYQLNQGEIHVLNLEVAGGGIGTLQQIGGAVEVKNWATVGKGAGSVGNYEISNGDFKAPQMRLAVDGNGTVTQSGGLVDLSAMLNVGIQPTGEGTYYLNGGTLRTPMITCGSGTSTLNVDGGTLDLTGATLTVQTLNVGHAAGSVGQLSLTGKTVTVNSLWVGGEGQGTYVQTGGTAVASTRLVLGYQEQGVFRQNSGDVTTPYLYLGYGSAGAGDYSIDGGTLTVSSGLVLGNSGGDNQFTQRAGSSVQTNVLIVGSNSTNNRYRLEGGQLDVATSVTVGDDSSAAGRMDIVDGALTAVDMTVGRYGVGVMNQQGGTVTLAGGLDVGRYGTGTVNQTGGTTTLAGNLYLGGNVGTLLLDGGAVLSAVEEYVGDGGTGTFNHAGGANTVSGVLCLARVTESAGTYLLGDATATGVLREDSPGAGVGLTVRDAAASSASAAFRGWGNVLMTGQLRNNGRAVADGYGTDRNLNLAHFVSIANDDALGVAQADGTQAGWYAVNRGRLVLPDVVLTTGDQTHNWGEEAGDTTLDLVNSMRVALANVKGTGALSIDLLAIDHGTVPSVAVGTLVDVWDVSVDGTADFDYADLVVRYDDAAAASLGIAEADLGLFYHTGAAWIDITSGIDTGGHWLMSDALTSFSVVAVGVGLAVPGDANGDGVVDEADAAAMADNWGQAGTWADGDFNGDGLVDLADASILAANWGYGESERIGESSVPEPAIVVLLLGITVMMVPRHRRLSYLDRT